MADTTISNLPNAAALTGTERVPMDQGATTVDATTQAIANLAPPTNLTYDAATRLLSSSTGEDVTLPLVNTTAAGLIPHTWLTGAEPAILPHIHGALAGSVYEHVRNVSGAPMAAMTPYHVVGSQGDTDRVQIIPANASDPATMPASGILTTALANNEDGHGVIAGVPTGLNTAANPSGTTLYVGNGVLTPTAPAANVQALAIVGRSHATTGTLSMLQGPALGNAAMRNVGTTAGTVAAGDDARLSDAREWTATTVDQAEAEAGTATTRRAWTAQRVLQAITAWWMGASTDPGRLLVTAVDAAAQRTALALSSADSPQFTGVGLGIAPRTGYAAALGAGVIPRGAVVTAVGSTYTCDIRTASRFLLGAAIAGNTTIEFTNVADLQVSGGFVDYAEFQIDFQYTSGVITISAGGFTTKWDGNTAAAPTAGEFEQLIVQITPAIPGTPFTTPTVKVAPMKGNT